MHFKLKTSLNKTEEHLNSSQNSFFCIIPENPFTACLTAKTFGFEIHAVFMF